MRRRSGTPRALRIAAFAVACTPGPAGASCDTGAPPSFDDVDYVKIVSYSLVGQLHPWFTYEASSTVGASAARVVATLDAHRATKFEGQWEAVDDVLRRDDFFSLRLHRAAGYRLDGPEDEIAVGRCGVETVVTTLPFGDDVELDDVQGRAFSKLERDLQDAVFSQQWRSPADGVRTWPPRVP